MITSYIGEAQHMIFYLSFFLGSDSTDPSLNTTIKYNPPDKTIYNTIVMFTSNAFRTFKNLTVLGWKAYIYKTNIPWQFQSWRKVIKKNKPLYQLVTQSQPYMSNNVGWTTHMLSLHQQFYINENDNIAIRVDGAMPLYEHACTRKSAASHNPVLKLNDIPLAKEDIQPGLIVEGIWRLTTCKQYAVKLITRRQLPGKILFLFTFINNNF